MVNTKPEKAEDDSEWGIRNPKLLWRSRKRPALYHALQLGWQPEVPCQYPLGVWVDSQLLGYLVRWPRGEMCTHGACDPPDNCYAFHPEANKESAGGFSCLPHTVQTQIKIANPRVYEGRDLMMSWRPAKSMFRAKPSCTSRRPQRGMREECKKHLSPGYLDSARSMSSSMRNFKSALMWMMCTCSKMPSARWNPLMWSTTYSVASLLICGFPTPSKAKEGKETAPGTYCWKPSSSQMMRKMSAHGHPRHHHHPPTRL